MWYFNIEITRQSFPAIEAYYEKRKRRPAFCDPLQAAGNAVQVVPVHAELTTQEVANIMNVSRPHMVKLLEEGQLPYHKTGRHRRILFADLMEYKKKRDADSLVAMQELAAQAQELGLGY